MPNHQEHHDLPSRVAAIESSITNLSTDLQSLTSDVRNISGQVKDLLVLVERAAAPRKTEWGVVGTFLGLTLAIGTAALSPVYMRVGDSVEVVNELKQQFRAHEQLQLHPVGKSRIDNLEETMKEQIIEVKTVATEAKDSFIPTARERLSTLELQVNQMDTFKVRERLILMEEKLKQLEKHKESK